MASNVAPSKNTGGGGFVFEDDVCAWLLACMLGGEPPFEPELGAATRIAFQTRPDGWFLDDALVTTRIGTTHHRCALSIKSNTQFTASAAPSDFVVCAWEQWLLLGSKVFERDRDLMGLVTAPLSGAAAASVLGLTAKVRDADPLSFPSRLAERGWASDDERVLFRSFKCPSSISSTSQPTDADTTMLLQRLRILQHDFGATISESLKRALGLCRSCVRSGSRTDADLLWNLLRGIASGLRPVAGSITLQQLVERLRHEVRLADYPDHAADWTILNVRSNRDASLVADAIAGRVRIPRAPSVDSLANAIDSDDLVVLLGASGAGKSAVAKVLRERRAANDDRTLWLDARSLDCVDFGAFEATLRLRYPLGELLASCASSKPVLILDGLDRLYSENAFRNAATLLRLARQEAPATRWRVIVPCQSQEWPRLLEGIQRAGAIGEAWRQLQLEPLAAAELKPVSDAMPALSRLLLQPKVGSLLTNLKMLDLVARHTEAGSDVDTSIWVGESSVADWFWSAEIDRGTDRIARGRFARALAQRQADNLVASVATDDFSVSELAPLVSLAADQVCVQVRGDRIAFGHDLYGDWARLRILLNHRSDLPSFFRGRRESPLWHRALRLLGIHLLEHSGRVADWRAVFASFAEEESRILQDVMLEAPVYAVNGRHLLDAILDDLVADDGRLLRRLLARFLAFATFPNQQMLAVAISLGMDANTARTTYRFPYWPLWLDILSFLHEHRAVILPVAPCEVARVVEIWLEFAPKGAVRRAEAAELGVLLGKHALATRETYGDRAWQRERERFYTCALVAAHERVDDVIAIALTASERLTVATPAEGEPFAPPPRRRRRMFGGTGVIRGPWPDGPRARVDEAFQKVVLGSPAIMDLYRVRATAAREVILANLIREPVEEDWNDHWMLRGELAIVDKLNWLPALYTQGPFLVCLRENFAEGLELVALFVEFATARAQEQDERNAREWRARAIAEGQPEASVDQLLENQRPRKLSLLDANGTQAFQGDERVYGWSAGLGNPPYPIQVALMALEQHFYQRLDDGKEIADEVAAVLARSHSVALLGVLCDIGKRQRDLFEGPLRPLLSAPEIYAWEITKLVHGRSHLMIGAFDKGEWFIKLARQFHGLEHRKIDLRNVAITLMLQRPAMRDYFERVRAAWANAPLPSGRLGELQQQLALAFDINNYEVREDPEHGTVIVNVEALRVHEERADKRRAMEEHMAVTTFPIRCRTILDERQQLDETQLAELWEQWGRIRELAGAGDELPNGAERFGDEYANAIAGGVAVFMRHSEWYSKEDTRRSVLVEALRSILNDPPERHDFDSDDSVANWTFDCFAAEAAAMLWIQDRENKELRRMVGEAALSLRYAAVRLVFDRCAEFRSVLGDDFGRLRRLALEWAYVRDRVEPLRRVPRESLQLDDEALKRAHQSLLEWAEERLGAFVSGSMPGLPNDWAECDDASRFSMLDAVRRRWPGHPGLDFHVVRCAHEWLPLPDQAHDDQEREAIIRFWRSALRIVVARPAADLSRRDHRYPQDDECWVLERVGATLLQLRDDEDPSLLWRPVLDLHGEGHDWPEVFAHSFHRHALLAEHTPRTYASLVRSMLQRAFVEVNGRRRWSWYAKVWDALLGVDWYSRELWERRHLGIVRDMQDVFLLWMDKVPMEGRRLAGFASWLARPPAAPLRFVALSWLLGIVRVEKERELRDIDEAEDGIASLLNVVWAEQENDLRADRTAFQTFRSLLGWLADRQNALGLELLGRLGGLS